MIGIINYIISQVGIAITLFISILPSSPFSVFVPVIDTHYMRFINYVFPFLEIMAILQAYLLAVVTFYGLRIVLRWLKVASA